MPAISICIINFNGEECLPETLAGVSKVGAEVAEVMVVDSASTDGSARLVHRDPSLRLIRLADNRGPGRARNVGFVEAKSNLILFVDNDVVVSAEAPEHLVRALASDQEAVFAMPRILYAHDPDTIQYDGAGSHFLGLMTLENADCPVDDREATTRPIQSLVTACFLADRARWGMHPLFDESLFIYLEDHDLGLRARIMGHRILSVPTNCYHGRGTPGLSLRSVGHHTNVRIENVIRNRWLILLKNYHSRTLLVLAPFLVIFECFQLAGAIKKGWLQHWLSGCRSILKSRTAILRERRAVQRSRETRDRDILNGGPVPFSEGLLRGGVEAVAGRLVDGGARGYWTLVRRFV